MYSEKLSDIRKELKEKNPVYLIELCLRLAKYKKEIKELTSYLLFYADDPMEYARMVKEALLPEFTNLNKHEYYATKSLRKIIRQLNKHTKFTASKQVEVELAIWFCKNFMQYTNTRSTSKALRSLFLRQLEKIRKVMPHIHEDLQFDLSQEYNNLVDEARQKLRGFSADGISL
ncbi:hypothetical protein FW774_13935 [Pedobacter sp. BS3]|uniref:hypothetical protein n=1 Tax=Pedobacter sp. BS3 TaxID=2567937 RepID=UPI0011EBAA69|nr:hypothetical protein [Pedobacter sp. BS3]TZF82603.1 hypothetical protein FW774_13935 [Pedobacter sp. BS3]